MEEIKQTNVDYAEVQYRMKKAGFTQADVARELRVTENAVSRAVRGHPSRRIQEYIAIRLNTDKKFLWPSIYFLRSEPRRGRRPK